ncbi:hypothetical protein WJX84_008286, partial [Apatococcus fuscideae]
MDPEPAGPRGSLPRPFRGRYRRLSSFDPNKTVGKIVLGKGWGSAEESPTPHMQAPLNLVSQASSPAEAEPSSEPERS